ncbi:hypothetical protein PICSAR132_03753 [Mycobacterium avium subsp. paratuberculosis]|nr:hypothetical protein PICSAR119_04344 [Mycobacterium avium subsp. paratuberculosis]CAG6933600.1 hypothetical protein PICSAR118_04371 [Mycobacterium avium subsp. paratuberculosis]CAG6933856.1 hypothetical protein PICSAR11_04315 [Mycobacterium avium subsp. paratuberculosis]CAG6933918.1 hypothetical protein PICSAR110_04396 [Mycobacterium avium subsp. paratuberculosis]CAG6934144.1 hypothetical protein PICSAR120_04335 [Mycobacterium avium subsp. paratuberculosis]
MRAVGAGVGGAGGEGQHRAHVAQVGLRVPDLLHELVGQVVQFGDRGHEVVRLLRQHTEHRCEICGDPDQLVDVVVEGLTRRPHRVVGARQQRRQLAACLGEGLHRLDGLVQRVQQIRRRLRQAPRRIQQGRHRGRAGVGADNRIELIEKAIQLRPGVEQADPPMIGSRPQGGQNSHRPVIAAAPRGGEQIAQLADRRLEQHGGQPLVLRNMGAVADFRAGPVTHQLHRRHGEHVAGHHSCGHTGRNRLGVVLFQVDVDIVGLAVGRGDDVVDHADQHAVVFDVRLLRQAVAHVDQVGHHPHVIVQPASRFHQHHGGEQGADHQHRDADAEQLPVRGAASVQLKGIGHRPPTSPPAYPPNLAPESTPHSAMVSSMFTMITTVMLARMPCPAATPTPSGPPLA